MSLWAHHDELLLHRPEQCKPGSKLGDRVSSLDGCGHERHPLVMCSDMVRVGRAEDVHIVLAPDLRRHRRSEERH